MIHFRLRYEGVRDTLVQLRSRVRGLRAAWRGIAALALLLPITALWPRYAATDAPKAWGPILLGLPIVVAGVSWLWDRRSERREASPAWLDRRLGLGELLVTAYEVDRRGARTGPERWLLDDAASALAERAHPRALRGDAVEREVEALWAALLLAIGLGMAWGWLRGLPAVAELGPPGSRGQGGAPGAVGHEARTGDSAALRGLGGQWSDHAALRPAARALERGDAASGARALRALADRAPQLSEVGARDLAEAMADSASAGSQALRDALEAAERALREGEAAEQAAALESLAGAIEQLPGSAGARRVPAAMDDRRDGPASPRLAVEPKALDFGATEPEEGASAAEIGAAAGRGRGLDAEAASEGEGASAGVIDREPRAAEPSIRGRRPALRPEEREIARRYFQRGDAP